LTAFALVWRPLLNSLFVGGFSREAEAEQTHLHAGSRRHRRQSRRALSPRKRACILGHWSSTGRDGDFSKERPENDDGDGDGDQGPRPPLWTLRRESVEVGVGSESNLVKANARGGVKRPPSNAKGGEVNRANESEEEIHPRKRKDKAPGR